MTYIDLLHYLWIAGCQQSAYVLRVPSDIPCLFEAKASYVDQIHSASHRLVRLQPIGGGRAQRQDETRQVIQGHDGPASGFAALFTIVGDGRVIQVGDIKDTHG